MVQALDAMRLCDQGGYRALEPHMAIALFQSSSARDWGDLRDFAWQVRLSPFPLSSVSDSALTRLIERCIQDRNLVALRDVGGEASGGGPGNQTAALRRLVRAIEARLSGPAKQLTESSRHYRLMADVDVAGCPDRDRYHVVERAEAVRVLDAIGKVSTGELAALLAQASGELTQDWRPPFLPDGMVLLRRVQAPRASVEQETQSFTPSQLRKAMLTWIAVEIVDERDEPWQGDVDLTLTDGSPRTVTLSDEGVISLEEIEAGLVTVTFPSKSAVVAPTDGAPPPAAVPAVVSPAPSADPPPEADPGPPSEAEAPAIATCPVCRLRVFGFHFETDKCFLLPGSMEGIRQIKAQYEKYDGYKVLVVGHADARGNEDHNAELSLERADAIHHFLTDESDEWLAWYDSAKSESKRWGTREDQFMLSILPEKATPYYAGPIDGVAGSQTTQAIKDFQKDEGLTVDGIAGPKTRKALIVSYMSLDNTSLPEGTEITTHGCGEFFPEVEADANDAKNRRVELFFFADAITPPVPGKLSAKGSTEYPQWKASAMETIDIETGDPGTADTPLWIRCHDSGNRLLTGGFCQVRAGGTTLATVPIDTQGWAKVLLPGSLCLSEVDAFWGSDSEAGPFAFSSKIYVSCFGDASVDLDKRRLHNLGYDTSDFELAVKQFQSSYLVVDASGIAEVGLTADGLLPAGTQAKLEQIYLTNDCDARKS